jgi:hypothetical protein
VPQLAPLEEVGQGQLLDDRGAEVVALLGGDHVGRHPLRHDQPAQPQPGGQGLGHRAGVDHVLGGQALDRADGLAVVAVLGVVVVLQHQRSNAGGPLHELAAAPG